MFTLILDELSNESEKEEEQVVGIFEDEMPEQSLKMKSKKTDGQSTRKRKKPASGFEPNYVQANLNRKRYVSKKSNAANAKRFKRFKRAK